jgi:two-component system cell cycle sensor histidine kinase/response regulator CckA
VQLLSRPHVHVRSDVINGSHMIAGSENQIYRALMNLCINALEAMDSSGGILELRLDTAEPEIDLRRVHPHLPPGACVRITVRDEGKGMAPEMLSRIFDQSFTTKSGGLNVGLGLTVARGIVRSHGGAIKAESQPGRGSSFSIYLPAT